MVVASVGISLGEQTSDEYMLSMYDTPEGNDLFVSAMEEEKDKKSPFRYFFLPKNRDKWEIAFEYVRKSAVFSKWQPHQTPRISVQVRVKEPFTVHINGAPHYLRKTRNWAEVAEWENADSDYRKKFDSDPEMWKAIQNWCETGNEDDLPDECRKMYPIEITASIKPDMDDFLKNSPHEFGMKRIDHVMVPIDYKLDSGEQGAIMAGIFEVERVVHNSTALEDLGAPRFLPPGYHYSPARAQESTPQSELHT